MEHKTLVKSIIKPVQKVTTTKNTLFIDFGKSAFGTINLHFKQIKNETDIIINLGESLISENSIDKNPPGNIRYISIPITIHPQSLNYTVKIPVNNKNTGRGAILMPEDIGEVFPFRYCEVENLPDSDVTINQVMVHYPFDDNAATFLSSDNNLNSVWDLCSHTIKATTFCGIYVDGDRERIPYEGDAYINQLSHYALDSDYSMARRTQEYLLKYPTWPTEWQLHMVLMAWEDWIYTGDISFLKENYSILSKKTLMRLSREDMLISTLSPKCNREFEKSINFYNERYAYDKGLIDLVDWPPGSFTEGGIGERDNHEMMPINSVVNAFHYRTLVLMGRIAKVIGLDSESDNFNQRAQIVKESFNRVFLNTNKGIYIDGEGSEHSSLHSNMFALSFGLVPDDYVDNVIEFIKSRGMACSVYAAQFLLEALYTYGEADYALSLMTAEHDRSWINMIKTGSTMTLEAWDIKYKKNLDWNHAWGTAPTNIISRYLLGIRPVKPDFREVLIEPQIGSLKHVSGKVPTKHGQISISIEKSEDGLAIDVNIPEKIKGTLIYPDGSITKFNQ